MRTAREILNNSELECDFQSRVIRLAESLGWYCYHTHDSRRSQKGFPDLVMVRGDTCLFVELKRESGSLSVDQSRWLSALREVKRVDAFLLRPSGYEALETLLQTV